MKPPNIILRLLLVIGVGVALRMDVVLHWPLTFDEAFSFRLIDRFSWVEMIRRTADDTHPPLYYLTLRAWSCCCGNSLVALRLLSLVCGAGTIAGCFVMTRDGCSLMMSVSDGAPHNIARLAGLVAAGLAAVSASHVLWSGLMRMYAMGTLLALASGWCLLWAIHSTRNKSRWSIGYCCATAMFLYTHNYALLVFAAQMLFLIVYASVNVRSRGEQQKTRCRGPLAAWCAAAGAYAPWFVVVLRQNARVQNEWWAGHFAWSTVPNAWRHAALWESTVTIGEPDALTLAAFTLLIVVLGMLASRGRATTWLIASMAAIPLMIAAILSWAGEVVISGRYLMFVHVFFLCGAAYLIATLRPTARRLCVSLALLNTFMATVAFRLSADEFCRDGLRMALDHVRQCRADDEPIVMLDPMTFVSATFHLGLTAPFGLLYSGEIPHYMGRQVIEDNDRWNFSSLRQLDASGLWILSSGAGYRHLGDALGEWCRTSESRQFAGHPSITVTHYSRGTRGDASPSHDGQ